MCVPYYGTSEGLVDMLGVLDYVFLFLYIVEQMIKVPPQRASAARLREGKRMPSRGLFGCLFVRQIIGLGVRGHFAKNGAAIFDFTVCLPACLLLTHPHPPTPHAAESPLPRPPPAAALNHHPSYRTLPRA